jgi:glycine cleavage system P protein (glycine dehydrogenase) subunit 1
MNGPRSNFRVDDLAHPFVPNSATETYATMLAALGLNDVDDLYSAVPERLRTRDSPEFRAFHSEAAVRRHIERLVGMNRGCEQVVSFLGGGCAQHYVPAVCDEINQRSEFLTSYFGQFYSDHGKLQALFEYASMIGELVEFDLVGLPTYDWASAAATSIRMAARITGRNRAVVVGSVGPDRLGIIRSQCGPDVEIDIVGFELGTGRIDLEPCRAAISRETAAVYFENPSYLGVVDDRGDALATLVHDVGGLLVVGVDPLSLGVLTPPSQYGADIVCGDLQPLGVHMSFGGGLAGFVATPDDERFVDAHPGILIGLTSTSAGGEHGFGYVRPDRTVYLRRENGNDFTGTTTGLWAITAAVYLTLLGAAGLREVGLAILQRAQYAAARLDELRGVAAPALDAAFFKEFTVRFEDASVSEINRRLLGRGFFGGHSLRAEFSELGEAALYCVTEVQDKESIDMFVENLGEVVSECRGALVR